MPRMSAPARLGAGAVLLAALLTLWIILGDAASPKSLRALVLSPLFWPYVISGALAILFRGAITWMFWSLTIITIATLARAAWKRRARAA